MNEYVKKSWSGEDIFPHSTYSRRHEGRKWIDVNIRNVQLRF